MPFFKGWQDLTKLPDNNAYRQSLLSYADNLSDMFSSTTASLKAVQSEMDVSINQSVDRINTLAKGIADLNRQITTNTVDGVSNPNALLDRAATRWCASWKPHLWMWKPSTTARATSRAAHHRATAGAGAERQRTQGHRPRAESNLTAGSAYTGKVEFQGSDSHEYTVEILNGGNVGDTPPPSFRVSLTAAKRAA